MQSPRAIVIVGLIKSIHFSNHRDCVMYGTRLNFPKVFEFEKMCIDIARLKNLKK
jgi:hypothetical protein